MTTALDPITFDFKTVDRAVRLAIELKGEDYVYEMVSNNTGGQCVYINNGSPSCLVGHALDILGLDLSKIETVRENSMSIDSSELKNFLGISFDEPTQEFLEALQGAQDAHETWGDSYVVAKRIYNTVIGDNYDG